MSEQPAPQSGPIAVCTLADGDYFAGAGALANSLHAGGFRGVVWIGYRGALPGWAGAAAAQEKWHELPVAPGLALRFVIVAGQDTLALAKPDFALRVLDELAPDSSGVTFFDADIVALAPWSYFVAWMGAGVGCCTEVLPFKHANHPHRVYWRDMIRAVGRQARDLDLYFNSGFLSVPRQHRDMLLAWSQLIGEYRRRVAQPVPGIRHGERLGPLWATDQEMLNAAAMASTVPLSVLGPEGMNFAPLDLYMSHAVSGKPWRARYLRAALAGKRPTPADRHFWRYAGGPIAVASPATIRRQRLCLRLAAALGRFYGSS